MVKLEKKIVQKKPDSGKLQKPLKTKNKKDKVVGKEAKLIKEAVKSEVVEQQNGKAGKKNKKAVEETPVVSKKNKKGKNPVEAVIESPEPVPAQKKEKKKGNAKQTAPEPTVEPVKEEKPLKKGKKVKANDIVEAPTKKAKKVKEPVPEEVVAPKKVKVEETKKGKKADKVKPEPVEKKVKVEVKKEVKSQVKAEVKPPSEAPISKKAKKQLKATLAAQVETAKPGKPVQNGKAKGKAAQNGSPVKPKALAKLQAKKAAKTGKKGKTPAPSVKDDSKQVFEAPPFDEEDFNKILTHENIVTIVKGLKKTVKKETESKKEIFSDYRYLLDVTSHKIGNCPKRMVKLTLKHSIPRPNEDDIVLFVCDLQRGRKVDHDPTIQHYEDLLRRNNIEGVKVIPFNQLKNEYSGYENKRKLANTFEHFLCDGRIVSDVVGFLGAITQKPRTTLHAVRLNDHNDVGAAIKKGIRRTAFKQINKGNMTTIPIASHRHTPEEVADNILATLKQLKTLYPGGLGNIRSLNLKVGVLGTSSLPLYMSMVQGPDANPYVVGPREQKMLKLKRETKDVLTKFQFTNEGTIQRLTQEQILKKRKIQEGKAGEAVSEEVKAKKAKKEKKKKNKEVEEEPKEEEKIEELVRLEQDEDDSDEEDGAVELVKEGEEFEDDDEEEDDEDEDDDSDE
ncbi:RSL1D1 family protein [Megaselia abdita]